MNTRVFRYGLIFAAVVAAYVNSFAGSFQFDDFNVIVDNPEVHSFSAWLSGLPGGIRPLLKLSYVLNWASGGGVFGFHLFNTVLHAANSLLICFLSLRFFGRRFSPPDAGHAALFAALLFALHPVQTEAVTYVSGRSMSLMAFFWLASLLAYARGADERRTAFRFLLSPLLFGAACAVRETAAVLPLALALWDVGTGQAMSFGQAARRQWAHWLLLLGLAVLFVFHPAYPELIRYGFGARGMGENLLSQVNGVFYLLSRLVLVDRLSIDPGLPVATGWSFALAAKAAFLLALMAAGFALLRRRPWTGFGLLWFFLQLLPTNSFIPRLDIANERHLYLASWGIALAVSGEAVSLRMRGKAASRTITVAAAGVLIVLAVFTMIRNRAYQSEVALWEDTVRTTPVNARAHNNLGFAYAHAGQEGKALEEYREALRLRPGYETARENIGALTAAMKAKRDAAETEKP